MLCDRRQMIMYFFGNKPNSQYDSLSWLFNITLFGKNNYIATMSETLCAKCKKFFGNPQTLNMCSVCFK
jgi:hypothetical protein